MTLAGINNTRFAATQFSSSVALAAPPVNGKEAKSQPLYLRGAAEAKSRTEREEERQLELTTAPDADTFIKTAASEGEGDASASSLAADVKGVLKEGSLLARKGSTAYLLKCAAGIDLTQSSLLNGSQPEATQQEELQQTAESIKNLGNEEKIRLVGDITGGDSVYTRYAKNRLLGESGLALKETMDLFRPQTTQKTLEGYREAFAAVGTGLLTLAIAGVGGPLFSAAGLGKYVAALGVVLS